MADANNLANVLPINLRFTAGGTLGGVQLERDEVLWPRKKHTFATQVRFCCAFDQPFPRLAFDKHQIKRRAFRLRRLELSKSFDAMIKSVAKLTDEIKPLRSSRLRHQEIKIDGIADVAEENDRIAANKQAGQLPFGSKPQDGGDILFHVSDAANQGDAVAEVFRFTGFDEVIERSVIEGDAGFVGLEGARRLATFGWLLFKALDLEAIE